MLMLMLSVMSVSMSMSSCERRRKGENCRCPAQSSLHHTTLDTTNGAQLERCALTHPAGRYTCRSSDCRDTRLALDAGPTCCARGGVTIERSSTLHGQSHIVRGCIGKCFRQLVFCLFPFFCSCNCNCEVHGVNCCRGRWMHCTPGSRSCVCGRVCLILWSLSLQLA